MRSCKSIFAVFFTLLCLMAAQRAYGAWYNTDWLYRQEVVISPALADSDLANYPYLMKIGDGANGLFAGAKADGGDILFTLSDGETKLSHEIEKYANTPGSEEFVAWVNLPSLSSTGDTRIYIYYGNASAPAQENPSAVWGADYEAVWHLHDDFEDSTVNNNDAANNGSTSAAGEAAAGRDFNGTTGYIQTPSGGLKTSDEFTVSFWFKADATNYAHHLLWQGDGAANGWGESTEDAQEMHISLGDYPLGNPQGTPSDDLLSFFLGDVDETWNPDSLSLNTPFTDTTGFNFVAVTVSGLSTSPSAEMFLNGVSVDTDTGTTARTGRGSWNTDLRMGRPGTDQRYFDGILDEVRLSTGVKDADWIRASYRNQGTPEAYQSLGAEEPQDSTAPAAVGDLATGAVTSSSIELFWTAPGDDGNAGMATTYDIRYSTTAINNDNAFDTATQVSGEPAPGGAGTSETFTVTGLSAGTTYHFAIKAADEAPNWSPLSNAPSTETSAGDVTAPADIADLAIGTVTATSVELTWTAPGDDGNTGTASTYDIRYRTNNAVTDGNWTSATQVTGEPSPGGAGATETFTITGLTEGQRYYFAIETADEVPNSSGVSNSPAGTPNAGGDSTPPATVSDLATGAVTSSSVELTWTAPGDDENTGTAATYDIRYSTTAINNDNVFDTATQVTGEPAPQMAGSGESFTVTGLVAGTSYHFAIKASDEVPNESALSNAASGSTSSGGTLLDRFDAVAYDNSDGTADWSGTSWTEYSDDGDPGAGNIFIETGRLKLNDWDDLSNDESVHRDADLSGAVTATLGFDFYGVGAGGLDTVVIEVSDNGGVDYKVLESMDVLTTTSGSRSYTLEDKIGLTSAVRLRFRISSGFGVTPQHIAFDNLSIDYAVPPDTTAPSAVSDLAGGVATATSIELTWTASGDDGNNGTANSYDIRYATSAIDEGSWNSATRVVGEPAPMIAGSAETFTVTGLSPNTAYYFAVKVIDDFSNKSGLSNSAYATTLLPDLTPPAAVGDLDVGALGTTTVELTWTAPGDDGGSGTAASYDIRYSTSPIDEGNWEAANQAVGEPPPQEAGGAESFTVIGLSPGTTYYFALKTADEVPNGSGLSNIASGATVAADILVPSAVSDLTTGAVTVSSVELSWTATGDDGGAGTASFYDLRYSDAPITDANWNAAVPVSGEPVPGPAASLENFTVTGLDSGSLYYFALKVADESANWSGVSNSPFATTDVYSDLFEPSAVGDLAVSGTVGATGLALSWTSPGDDGGSGTATSYDLRYSTSPIDEGNWGSATQVAGELPPQVGGSPEHLTVTGLAEGTLYYFALKTSDEVPNESGLSNVASGTTESCGIIQTLRLHPSGAAPGDEMEKYVGDPVEIALDTHDEDSSYGKLNKNISAAEARLELDDTAQTGEILSVQIKGSIRDEDGNVGNGIRIGLKTGGSEYWGPVIGELPKDYRTYAGPGHSTNPETSSPWTWSEVNALAALVDSNDVTDFRITELYAEVVYLTGGANCGSEVELHPSGAAAGDETRGYHGGIADTCLDADDGDDSYAEVDKLTEGRFELDDASRSGVITSVQIKGVLREGNDKVGDGMRIGLKTNGSEYWGPLAGDIPETYGAYSGPVYATNPATGSPWSWGEIDALTAMVANATDLEKYRVTELWAAVTYEGEEADAAPPSAIAPLNAGSATMTSVALSWTAPGDDGGSGMATLYDVRYSTSEITEANWASATQALGEPAPSAAGSLESFTVTGLSPETTFYFAVKTRDEVPNISALSEVASAATLSPPPPHHFSIEHGGSGLTCQRSEVTLRVCADADCSTLYEYPVSLTMSPNGWVGGDTMEVTGLANLQLRHHTPEAVELRVVSSTPSPAGAEECYVAGSPGSCYMSFYDSGFIFDVPHLTACRDTSVEIRAVRTDETSYECVASGGFAGKTKTLNFWSSYASPADGTDKVKIEDTVIDKASPGTGIVLTFDGNARSSFRAYYGDAGSLNLDVRYEGVGEEAGLVMVGNDSFVSAPERFNLTVTTDGSSPLNNAGTSGSPALKSGENFRVEVEAVCDDDSLLPNFAADTALSAVAPFEPAEGALGALAGGSIASGDFAGGSATAGSVSYGEVGNVTLRANSVDYLGSGIDVAGESTRVGRFTPDHFDVSYNVPSFGAACGSFTYIDQPFGYLTAPVIEVTAKNLDGDTTTNYFGSWWKIDDDSLSAKSYAASEGTLDTGLVPLVDPTIAESGSGVGILTFGGGLAFVRSSPVEPFDADISLSVNVLDSDGIAYGGNPATFGSIGFSGGSQMRFGRLRLKNAHGSELLGLGVPIRAEYYVGGGFSPNSQDSCTSVALSAFSLSSSYTDTDDSPVTVGPVAGNIPITINNASNTTSATLASLSSGEGALNFSPPAPSSDGYVDVKADLTSLYWLRYDWDGDASNDDEPTARASFGLFEGSERLIFIMESVLQ